MRYDVLLRECLHSKGSLRNRLLYREPAWGWSHAWGRKCCSASRVAFASRELLVPLWFSWEAGWNGSPFKEWALRDSVSALQCS